MAVNLIQLIMLNTLVFTLTNLFLGIFILLKFLTNSVELDGILSKLRHFTTKETLLSVYYAIFYMTYGCLVRSLTTIKNIDSITKLQKKVLRNFKFCTK